MQRKSIRATVGGVDKDIPIHTFLPNQFVYYDGSGLGALTSLEAVRPVGTPTAGNVAQWFNANSINDSGISLANVVTTTATPTAGQVPVFTGVGKAVSPTVVTIVGGAISNVTALDGRDPTTFVTGPVSAVSGNLPSFSDTTGKAIQDSGVALGAVVTNSGTSIINNIALFSDTTGKHIYDAGYPIANVVFSNFGVTANHVTAFRFTGSTNPEVIDTGLLYTDLVRGPASAVNGNLALFNGTSGKLIDDTGISVNDVVFKHATPVVNDNLPGYFGTSGKIIYDTGISRASVVTSASTPSANQVAVFTGVGKAVQNVTVTIAAGAITNVTSINAVDPATWVVGPASAASGNLASYNGTTGKLIQDAGVVATNVVTTTATITAGDLTYFTGTGKAIGDSGIARTSVVTTFATPSANTVSIFTGTGIALNQTSVTITGSPATHVAGASDYNGVVIEAHESRHVPGGADSMFSGSWNAGDDPAEWNGTTFVPKARFGLLSIGNTITGSLRDVTSPATFTLVRDGNYIVYWDLLVTTDGTAGTFTVNILCTSGSFEAVTECGPGKGACVNTVSGASSTVSIASGTAAFTVRTRMGIAKITGVSASVGMSIQWSGATASLASLGTVLCFECVS